MITKKISKAEIICIGDELLLGKTIDTNSIFISLELLKLGIRVKGKSVISDNESEIIQALKRAEDSDLIIITGGLGPTKDDITKNTICKYFDTSLKTNNVILKRLKTKFKSVGRNLNDLNKQQAELPIGANILFNDWGTAPGMIIEKYNSSFVFFPGVPIEMRSIFKTYFLPIIKKQLGGVAFEYYDVETIGISESKLSFLLSDIENNMPDNISLAYLPSLGHVLIRLYVKGIGMTMEAKKLKQKIIDLVGESVIGKGELEIEKWLINVLSKKRQMIAFAESCTGGKIASKLTALPGCSKIFKGSIVAYNDHIKSDILDVQYLSIEKHGSVSQQVVKEMLIGVIKKFKVDLGIAVSGIAGPDGGSHEKPIGTVWIGVGDGVNQKVELFRFKGNREQIIELVSITALNQLRKFILEIH